MDSQNKSMILQTSYTIPATLKIMPDLSPTPKKKEKKKKFTQVKKEQVNLTTQLKGHSHCRSYLISQQWFS
jgi:hypothetical protein